WGEKNGRSLQGKLTDGTVVEVEAGASFYTDPSSDLLKFFYAALHLVLNVVLRR
ncbi:hypothetical protein TNCV_5023831, partial [Trichonephila clavipes]